MNKACGPKQAHTLRDGHRTYAHRHCEPLEQAWPSSLSRGGFSGLLCWARNDKGFA